MARVKVGLRAAISTRLRVRVRLELALGTG